METILKANKIAFYALDVATDEKARMLWGRRAGKRKLPGLVRMGMVVGDLEEVEEWNEYGELRENVEPSSKGAAPSAPSTPSKVPLPPSTDTPTKAPTTSVGPPITNPSKSLPTTTEIPPRPPPTSTTDSSLTAAMRQAGFEAAKKAGDAKFKARAGALQASKADSQTPTPETLQKLDNSGPTGMPPPSGTTEAAEAIKPESGETSAEGKADGVPTVEAKKEEANQSPNANELQKLDNSGPTGMPPPSGSTEAAEATKPETGDSSVLSKADDVPATKEDKVEATQVEKVATVDVEQKQVTGGAAYGGGDPPEKGKMQDTPYSKELEESANNPILADEAEDVFEGNGQADSPATEDEIPSSKEVEEAANASIMRDKSHIVLAGVREMDRTPPSEPLEQVAGFKSSGEKEGPKSGQGTTATDEGQDMPEGRTQDQPAASGQDAGNSVAE